MSRAARWHDADFASDVESALVKGPHPTLGPLLFMLLMFFVSAFLWAYGAEIDEVTRGQGRVIPSSQVQVVQNLEGGIVKDILVSEGQTVEKGDVLLRIDDTGFASSFGELKAQQYALEARRARLTAQAENKPLQFPPELLAEARQVALNEEELYHANETTVQNQVEIMRVQADQRKQELNELHAKLRQIADSLKLAKEELELTAPLAEKGVVSKVDLLRIRRQVSDLQGNFNTTQTSVPRAESAVQEANRRVQEKLNTYRSQSLTDLNDVKAQLAQIKESLSAARDRVRRTDVASPVRGIVKTLHVRTVGGVIKPGMDLVEIVPLEDTLLVEARIRPADIAFLRLDQKATVKLSAYDFSIYGGLNGKLEQISADTITDQDGNSFYKVMIRTDRNYLERHGKKLPIIPGMVATVDVLTGRKTVLDYLLKPILKTKQEALSER
jgi:membrane fusion protein, adhesin transport system